MGLNHDHHPVLHLLGHFVTGTRISYVTRWPPVLTSSSSPTESPSSSSSFPGDGADRRDPIACGGAAPNHIFDQLSTTFSFASASAPPFIVGAPRALLHGRDSTPSPVRPCSLDLLASRLQSAGDVPPSLTLAIGRSPSISAAARRHDRDAGGGLHVMAREGLRRRGSCSAMRCAVDVLAHHRRRCPDRGLITGAIIAEQSSRCTGSAPPSLPRCAERLCDGA